MKIGIPREVKQGETRVALTPKDAAGLIASGRHKVFVESGAGAFSGYWDKAYLEAGAAIADSAKKLYESADMIVKVKEPQPSEYDLLKDKQIFFSFLHLAAHPRLVEVFLRKNITAVAFETVQSNDGRKPILYPMSVIAGRLAVQAGMHYLSHSQGLLISDAVATVLGAAGTVGGSAVKWLAGLGCKKINAIDFLPGVAEKTLPVAVKSRKLHQHFLPFSYISPDDLEAVAKAVQDSHLLILAALVPGAAAPKVIARDMVALMTTDSVLVDVAIDQGGNSETSRPTSLANPVYLESDVIHYCVPNIPAIVPKSATPALSFAVLPYLLRLADLVCEDLSLKSVIGLPVNTDLRKGLQVYRGAITNEALAASLGQTRKF